MNFVMISLNQSINGIAFSGAALNRVALKTEQNYAAWILIALLFILKQKTYEDIADDAEKWFDISNYDETNNRPLPIGKKKKIGIFKGELGGKIIKEFVALRAKAWAYLMDLY